MHRPRSVEDGSVLGRSVCRAPGFRHFFIEHDDPTDALASVRSSFRYLNGLP
jgi:hypothetical protein